MATVSERVLPRIVCTDCMRDVRVTHLELMERVRIVTEHFKAGGR